MFRHCSGFLALALWAGAPILLASETGVSLVPPSQPPVASQAPLPSLQKVMDCAIERAKLEEQNDRGFQQHYAYKRIKVSEEWNGRDSARKREEKISLHLPKAGAAIPVTIKVPASRSSSGSGQSLSKKDFAINKELLDRFQFSGLRRDFLDGRPTLVLDFKPAAKTFPIHSFTDRFLNKATGQLWVDEEEFVLVKTDIHLTEAVPILGGLAGSVNALTYRFDRERTPDGFWFTKQVMWHLEGREFLVHKNMEHREEKFEVRRVH